MKFLLYGPSLLARSINRKFQPEVNFFLNIPLNPSENIRCVFRNLTRFKNLHWTWSQRNHGSNFGIERNRKFSTQEIFVFGHGESTFVQYSQKISLAPPPNIKLLFGNTKRFCTKVWFCIGGIPRAWAYSRITTLFAGS